MISLPSAWYKNYLLKGLQPIFSHAELRLASKLAALSVAAVHNLFITTDQPLSTNSTAEAGEWEGDLPCNVL